MNLDKLKESARRYEQSSQWRQAIDVYKRALREFEESGEGVPDPSLYNRLGDLELKNGDSTAAVRAYEQASDLYTEQGFVNNAIALCGKILRISPARATTYLRLAQLHARKNFIGEAKKNLAEYIARMEALKQRDQALAAVRMFAQQFGRNPEVRPMVVDLLRGAAHDAEVRQQFEKLALEVEARGEEAGEARSQQLAKVDPESERLAPPRAPGGDLVFIDLGLPDDQGSLLGDSVGGEPIAGLDLGASSDPDSPWQAGTVDGLDFIQPVAGGGDPSVPSDLLTVSPFDESDDVNVVTEMDRIDIDAFPPIDRNPGGVSTGGGVRSDDRYTAPADDAVSEAGPRHPDSTRGKGGSGGLVFLPTERPPEPDDPAVLARDRANILFEIGDREGAIAALEEALRQFEESGRWAEALEAGEELTRAEPEAIFRFQKRVELAYRMGERSALLQAYLGLAEALLRGGGTEHAVTVYRRVLEHDPENGEAQAALSRLVPPETFVDLVSLILDEPQVRDTRMRVDQQAPIEDEDQAFHEALEQFKRGIEENLDTEDFQAHYDLGIAFKEMGLLDEAIAQFQKALRAPEGRLKTSEQLGIAFYEKGRYAIAEAVLRRAIDSLPGGDEEKVGSIYWLGRALEAQRRTEEAIRYYERVLAVDIRFLDVGDRMHRLTAEPQ